MKDYLKLLYEDFKINDLKSKISFLVLFIVTLPMFFSLLAMEAYCEGTDYKSVVLTLVLNSIILWTFIILALL